MPKVSVIIPNYNHAPYLRQRIDSILKQTYPDFEIIILDDCSRDDSRNVIEEYRNNSKVSHIIYNEANSGNTFNQWEKGIRIASGELIWIAESDDSCDPSFLKEAVGHFENNQTLGLCQFNSLWINEHDKLIYEEEVTQENYTIDGKEFALRMWRGNPFYNASAVVFKKDLVSSSIFQKIQRFKYCGDWMFWILILQKTTLQIDPRKLNYYRRHSNSVSSSSEKNGLSFIEGIQVYFYLRKSLRDKPELIKKYDRNWINDFAKKSFSLNITFKFFKKIVELKPSLIIYWLYYKTSFFHNKFVNRLSRL